MTLLSDAVIFFFSKIILENRINFWFIFILLFKIIWFLLCRVPTVWESQGILKYRSLDQLFMHYFHNFCRLLGLCPTPPPGLHTCKHCRLVYCSEQYLHFILICQNKTILFCLPEIIYVFGKNCSHPEDGCEMK